MYAVIRTGGKQYRVSPGDQLRVELLGATEASLTPLLVVDGETVTTEAGALEGFPVAVREVDQGRGKKIRAGKYKNKTRQRKRWGHRQDFSLIEVTSIGSFTAPAPDAPEPPVAASAQVGDDAKNEAVVEDDAADEAATEEETGDEQD